ncbi:Retrovirus-related Pol polyprotein from transposon TNT 1-94 [Sesamum angolense]|uniref:Retrovirus-related Pol polyprotein from transposon TNT 1-94 n=1 Tax=Sesamum angolense TaxID=2727404 RepID=A0AAE1WPX3_9LAMI|nr:Retrovirus-related Pol polyprotein from transposon TNT 1-94 [Sesamum angolense]
MRNSVILLSPKGLNIRQGEDLLEQVEMAMAGAKFEVVKFDGTGNFGLWQTRVKDLLAQQWILKALRPQKSASIDDEDWEELLQCAAGTIRLCLADEIMYHVMNLKSQGEVWKKLEIQFMSKSITNKLYLKQRLYGLKMQEGSDLAQHVNVFNQIITDLARLDVNIEDEDRAMILLCSLPFSYEHLVTTLTYGKETIKIDEITVALLAHNQWKTECRESSHGDSLYVKGNQDRGRKSETEGFGKRNSRSKSSGRKTIHCYKCKEPGHMKRDCPKLKKQADEKQDDSSKSANVVQNDDSDYSDGDMLSVSTNQYVDAWILDSGCSYHITPNREWFSSLILVLSIWVMIDAATLKVWVYFLKQKSEVFAKFNLWKAEVENQTVRKTPQQNGVAERMNRSLTEMARCLRLNAGLPKSFWAEAVSMACYLINRSPRTSLGGKVAEEVWTGYKKGVKGYKFWDPVPRKMVISRDAVFDEQSMLQQHQNVMSKVGSSSDTLQMELEPHPVTTQNYGRSHRTSSDPVAAESDGSSTTNELHAYNLARDRQRRTNVKPQSRLGYEDMVSFALLVSGDETNHLPWSYH